MFMVKAYDTVPATHSMETLQRGTESAAAR